MNQQKHTETCFQLFRCRAHLIAYREDRQLAEDNIKAVLQEIMRLRQELKE